MVAAWGVALHPSRLFQHRPTHPGKEGNVDHRGLIADRTRRGQPQRGLRWMPDSAGRPELAPPGQLGVWGAPHLHRRTPIAERYARRSLGITSNPVFSEWGAALPTPRPTRRPSTGCCTTQPSSSLTFPATGLMQPSSGVGHRRWAGKTDRRDSSIPADARRRVPAAMGSRVYTEPPSARAANSALVSPNSPHKTSSLCSPM